MPLDSRKRVVIVGFCSTNRDLAPYEDGTFEIWGLNRGYLFQERADRWFDLHSRFIITSQTRRPGKHVEFLRNFQGPVYVHQRFDELGDNQVVYPLKEVADFLGPMAYRLGKADAKTNAMTETTGLRDISGEPYISSSIAYEVALAIYEGFEEIWLVGVDLNTESEYNWQKPGVEWLLGIAAGRGIKVVLPDNCPLLKGTLYGRGFLSERPEHMSYEQLETRMKSLQHDHAKLASEQARVTGALGECKHNLTQMPPGIDHELMDHRRVEMEGVLAKLVHMLGQNEGALKETQYWLHQTMAGMEPKEAIDQLRDTTVVALDFGADGPLSELDALHYVGDAPNVQERELVGAGAAAGVGGYVETYGVPVGAD